MAEAEQILEEYKREQWAKNRDRDKYIEDMAKTASENKNQISNISDKLSGVEEKIGGVEGELSNMKESIIGRIGAVKKPVGETLGELCDGVNCIKEDIKKAHDAQSTIEKQMEQRFRELGERVHKLEGPTYICDSCGQDGIRPLSSFCPNCGSQIHQWMDPDTGQPVQGWSPYWKRVAEK